MKKHNLLMGLILGVVASLVLVACTQDEILTLTGANVQDEVASESEDGESDEGVAGEADGLVYDAPEWTSIPMVDVMSGETFTLADFAGKLVMVHPMATWCSNCRQQQGNIRSAIFELDRDDVVFISMSVESNLEHRRLAEYAENNQFPWTFVVAPTDLLVALTEQFGRTITNPPATPRFFIAADGTVSDLATGLHSTQAIIAELEALLRG